MGMTSSVIALDPTKNTAAHMRLLAARIELWFGGFLVTCALPFSYNSITAKVNNEIVLMQPNEVLVFPMRPPLLYLGIAADDVVCSLVPIKSDASAN